MSVSIYHIVIETVDSFVLLVTEELQIRTRIAAT